jgi:hypothetical protein
VPDGDDAVEVEPPAGRVLHRSGQQVDGGGDVVERRGKPPPPPTRRYSTFHTANPLFARSTASGRPSSRP